MLTSILLTLLLATAAAAQTPPPLPCAVSDDPTYGFTPENPIQIGGGAFYVKAREQRYLDALRGPGGQRITYKRRGSRRQSLESPGDSPILDIYEATYDGLAEPITLYIDAYHYWDQRAPKGLSCGQPFNLPPIPDAFQASSALLMVSMEQGATREFAPIPLDADGSTVHGAMWEGFRMLALEARETRRTGKPPAARPKGGTTVVAYPLSCGDRKVTPVAVDFVSPQGTALNRGPVAKDAEIAALLPGVTIPAGSVAVHFTLQQVRPTDRVRITYAEPACPETATEVTLPIAFTPSRGIEMPPPALPEAAKPEDNRVLLQVLIDLDGTLQRGTYAGGPAHLRQPALDAVKSWRAEPARVNGAPVPWATLVEVRFK